MYFALRQRGHAYTIGQRLVRKNVRSADDVLRLLHWTRCDYDAAYVASAMDLQRAVPLITEWIWRANFYDALEALVFLSTLFGCQNQQHPARMLCNTHPLPTRRCKSTQPIGLNGRALAGDWTALPMLKQHYFRPDVTSGMCAMHHSRVFS